MIFAVVSVVVLVAAAIIVAVFFATSQLGNSTGGSGQREGKIHAPSGTAFSVTVPQGFQISGDSDLRGGYLAADPGDGGSSWLDIYSGRAPRSQGPDLVGLAMAILDENKLHGAKITAAIATITVNGSLVARWQESYPETDQGDAYSQLNAVVYVGGKRDHLYLAYSDAPGAYSAPEAQRVLTAVVTSLPRPNGP